MENKKITRDDLNFAALFDMMFGVPLDSEDVKENDVDENDNEEEEEELELEDDDLPFCDFDFDPDDFCDEEDAPLENEAMWGITNINRVIFNPPATVICWEDGSKTVVKCAEGQLFDRYAGFSAAVMKKLFGSTACAKEIMEQCDVDNWKACMEAEKERRREENQAKEAKNREAKKHNTPSPTDSDTADLFIRLLADALERFKKQLEIKDGEEE